MKAVNKALETLVPISLLSLGLLTSAYGLNVVSDIPAMRAALSKPQPKLVPMPEVLEFSTVRAVVAVKGGK